MFIGAIIVIVIIVRKLKRIEFQNWENIVHIFIHIYIHIYNAILFIHEKKIATFAGNYNKPSILDSKVKVQLPHNFFHL